MTSRAASPVEPSPLFLALMAQRGEQQRRLKPLQGSGHTLLSEHLGIIQAMGKGDVLVFASALVRPPECDDDATELHDAMVAAARRGACFYYVRPDEKYRQGLWDFTRVEAQFDYFREVLCERGIGDAKDNVQCLFVKGADLFILPQAVWRIYFCNRDAGPMPQALMPGVYADVTVNISGDPEHIMPLNLPLTKQGMKGTVAGLFCALKEWLQTPAREPEPRRRAAENLLHLMAERFSRQTAIPGK